MKNSVSLIRDYIHGENYTLEQWERIWKHVLSELAAFTGTQVDVRSPLREFIAAGQSLDCLCTPRHSQGLGIRYRAIVSAITRPEVRGVHFGATLFVFCERTRLIASTGESFLDLEYEASDASPGWRTVGWFTDEYGEYDGIECPT